MRWIVLFSLLLLSKCLILAFGNISIQNHDSSIYKKSNCGKTLNSMYYATCRQRVCGQNKDNLCLHAARTLIWRSCAFNRGPMTMPVLDGPMTMPVLDGPMTMPVLDGPMTMPVLDGPMTMPVIDGVKPMAITLPICGTSVSLFWKRKIAYIAGLGRDQLEHLASPMTKSETSPSPNTNESNTSPRR